MIINCLNEEIKANKIYLINKYDFIIKEYSTKDEARKEAHRMHELTKDPLMILEGTAILKSELYNEVPCMNY